MDTKKQSKNSGLTGYPSLDMPWEKYYPEGAKNFDFPRMKAYDLIYELNKDRKDHIALEYEGNEITYGKLFERIDERTEFFLQNGIKENDIVTVSMLMSPEFVYDWYALGRINAISNLIDPRTSPDGIRHYLKEAESDWILNTDLFTSKIRKAIGEDEEYQVVNYSLLESADRMPFAFGVVNRLTRTLSKCVAKKDSRFEIHNIPDMNTKVGNVVLPKYMGNHPLTIVHTGGTTGMPKGVMLSHDNYNAMAYEYMKSEIGFAADDRFLLIMPPWISYGSGMLHMSLVTGMKATIISKLDSKRIADYVIRYQPQWFAGVPAHYKRIAASMVISKKGVPFLKAGAVGGDAMTAELYNTVNDYLIDSGAKQGVYPGYALTEVTSAFAVKQLEDYKPGSVGIPLPGGTVGVFRFDEKKQYNNRRGIDL
ncbi:MAG: acyl--CoA ligase [Lachnospiraceae bacterium]|nr:acyl--CoA ligase [Lachnospiraceae bacterium]